MNWDAIIPAIIAASSPLLMAFVIDRNMRRKQREDWDRQDAVADKLAKSNKVVADAAEEVGNKVTSKLDVIHTLVNSSLTEAILRAKTRTELYVVELEKDRRPAPAKKILISSLRAEIAEMESQLSDRAKQAAVVVRMPK